MEQSDSVLANRMLAGLPKSDRLRLTAHMTVVDLAFGKILHQSGEPIEHVYFPVDCLVSLMADCGERQTLEVELVGAEGVVGLSIFLDGVLSPLRAVVLKEGCAVRISTARLREECKRSTALQRALKLRANTLLARTIQLAACSHYHVLEARLARSLLLIRERLQTDRFHMTHETFSTTLGVRRVGVTRAAGALQQQKLIRYSRGDILILDADGLERASCGCYATVKRIARGE